MKKFLAAAVLAFFIIPVQAQETADDQKSVVLVKKYFKDKNTFIMQRISQARHHRHDRTVNCQGSSAPERADHSA
jgi:hypothetical protein